MTVGKFGNVSTRMAEESVQLQLELLTSQLPLKGALPDTPARVVKSWRTIYGGYDMDPEAILSKRFDAGDYGWPVMLHGIRFFSTCEHHMLPFFGEAHVWYWPVSEVVGLSKLPRLVDCFARRLQTQERMTQEIADAIYQHLKPLSAGVIVTAQHLCAMARGVTQQQMQMRTEAWAGSPCGDAVNKSKAEFIRLARRRKQ